MAIYPIGVQTFHSKRPTSSSRGDVSGSVKSVGFTVMNQISWLSIHEVKIFQWWIVQMTDWHCHPQTHTAGVTESTSESKQKDVTLFSTTMRHIEHFCGFLPFSKYTTKLTSAVPQLFCFLPLSRIKKSGPAVAAERGYFSGSAPERESTERSAGFPSAFIWPSQLSGFFLWLHTHLRGIDATLLSFSLWDSHGSNAADVTRP